MYKMAKNNYMTAKTTKTIKLQPKHRALSLGSKIVPWLSVSGIWLEENGFKAGGTVIITIENNQLIIKPL
jgi:Toxin SymE, type I toxin-antitoxin system